MDGEGRGLRPPASEVNAARLVPLVFVASIFVSAFLLFLVQPLVTRMLLPVYGGSPAVWNTALVFFQVLLLLGYLYAYLVSRVASRVATILLHGAVLLVPLLVLPPVVTSGMTAGVATSGWTAARLLYALGVLVALPFFALSSNSSLVQWWWSRSGLRGSQDPYWLYGASNTGSLLALLAYPFVLEPTWGVGQQTLLWSGGYGVFVVLTGTAMIFAMSRSGGSAVRSAPEDGGEGTAPSRRRVGMWIVRSAVGSSLLLSVSTQITTDLAPTPLLWVVPLALFLLTFILAFGMLDRLPRRGLVTAAGAFLLGSVGLMLVGGRAPFEITLAVSLGTLFFGALLCHRDLAAGRPHPAHLTAFYLWISFGGALGGTLNGLVAPLVFDSVAELQLTLMALALLLYVDPETERLRPYRPGWGAALLAGGMLILPVLVSVRGGFQGMLPAVIVAGLLWAAASTRYVGLPGLTVWMAGGLILGNFFVSGTLLDRERSFFGVISIRDEGDTVEMVHGNTIHGAQSKDPALRATPWAYYHPRGPLGGAILDAADSARIGIVGLGTGGLAALGQSGQHITYFEIDPVVERMAREHFTYLADSPADVDVHIGDGRLELEVIPEGTFDLLVIDAFSSDFIPVHLLTDEAIDLYVSKTRPGGLVVFHISSRHADLRRVLEGHSRARGRAVAYSDYSPDPEARAQGAIRTIVAATSSSEETIRDLSASPLWTRYSADIRPVRWSDDYSNILSVLR